MGGKWEMQRCYFLAFPSSYSHALAHSHGTTAVLPIPMGFPRVSHGIIIIIIFIRRNMTEQQGIECTKSSPRKCNKIRDVKTIIQNLNTHIKHKIMDPWEFPIWTHLYSVCLRTYCQQLIVCVFDASVKRATSASSSRRQQTKSSKCSQVEIRLLRS